MSKAQEMAKRKPEMKKVLDALLDLVGDHNVCCLDMGKLFNQVQQRFQQSAGAVLSDADLEEETRSLKKVASRESSICYRIGVKYNELRQLLGREDAEALIADHPNLEFSEAVLFGRVAEQFSEPQTVACGIHKMVQLVQYADLNGTVLWDADPGAIQISLLQNDGRWKRTKVRDCSTDELGQTVIAIKAQRGIPIDYDPWDDFDLD